MCISGLTKITYTRGLWASKLAVWEVLHGEQNLNCSQQLRYTGMQLELILDLSKIYHYYMKRMKNEVLTDFW